jgi:hypothetical protein
MAAALLTFAVAPLQAITKTAARQSWTHADYLANARRIGDGHPFIRACELAGVEPSVRQVALWRAGRGAVLAAAWARCPRSKNLPRLRATP